MNKLFALSTIIVSIFALVGCASTGLPVQVEAEYSVDATRSPIGSFTDDVAPERNVTDDIRIPVSLRSTVTQTTLVQGFASNEHSRCAWALVATSDKFPSRNAALAFAKERKLTDRRVAERCAPNSSERPDDMKIRNAALRPYGELALLGK